MRFETTPLEGTSAAGPTGLTIRGLCKTYSGGVKALDHVDLEVSEGMFGLLGPNGAGKSTLMRTIATLQTADAGSIRFRGVDVKDMVQMRRMLGYLPQDFGLYPYLDAVTLLDHLAVLKGMTDRKARRTEIEYRLNQVNLWAHRKKRLGTYSGGMRQRFGIAQALLGRPQLIIVDEPTAGLDPEERSRFLNLLAEIGDRVVIILSTHIVEDVEDLCTHMAILAGGRVRTTGTPRAAIEALKDRVWKKTVTRAELAHLDGAHDVISKRMFAGETIVHVLADDPPDSGFCPVEPDLEDVYFSTLHHKS